MKIAESVANWKICLFTLYSCWQTVLIRVIVWILAREKARRRKARDNFLSGRNVFLHFCSIKGHFYNADFCSFQAEPAFLLKGSRCFAFFEQISSLVGAAMTFGVTAGRSRPPTCHGWQRATWRPPGHGVAVVFWEHGVTSDSPNCWHRALQAAAGGVTPNKKTAWSLLKATCFLLVAVCFQVAFFLSVLCLFLARNPLSFLL